MIDNHIEEIQGLRSPSDNPTPTYFVRVGNSTQPTNKLQVSLLQQAKRWQHTLTTQPDLVYADLARKLLQANQAYPRCKPICLRKQQRYPAESNPDPGTTYYLSEPNAHISFVSVILTLVQPAPAVSFGDDH